MESQNEPGKENQLEVFDGELLHPSLDIKDGILAIGFRYRSTLKEEKEVFIVVYAGNIQIINAESFTENEKTYYFEKRSRKLIRIEEKLGITALNKFLNDYNGLKIDVSPLKIFEEILALIKKYIELEKEIDYFLVTAWILGTYFFPIFYAYPFLHIKAPKGSGKSQFLNLLTQLCFNAVKARPSLAAFGDTVDALRGTYLIDQADSLERKGNEELLDILTDSYKKSGGTRRILTFDKKRNRETVEFKTYSPKVFASIRELPEDLRDRCLIVPLIRSQRNFPDPDDSNDDWREVRGKIYTLLMTNYGAVVSLYSISKIQYRPTQEIIGRSLELWLPFEVILECAGMQEKIMEAKTRFLSYYKFSEYEPSELEEEVIKLVSQQLRDKGEIVLAPKEISELMDAEMFSSSDTSKQKAAKVGWVIKKFNLASEKKLRTKEGVKHLFVRSKVESIYQNYCKTTKKHTPLTPTDVQGINSGQITM